MKTTLTLLLICLALTLTACGRKSTTPTNQPPAATLGGNPQPTNVPIATSTASGDTTAPASAATPTAAPRPRATVPSSGPLSVMVYVANCKSAPTTDKPGNVTVQISVEATGGNGVYKYFNQGVEEPDKFIDIAWERGTRLIGKVMVTSGDGQTVEKEYDVSTGSLDCP